MIRAWDLWRTGNSFAPVNTPGPTPLQEPTATHLFQVISVAAGWHEQEFLCPEFLCPDCCHYWSCSLITPDFFLTSFGLNFLCLAAQQLSETCKAGELMVRGNKICSMGWIGVFLTPYPMNLWRKGLEIIRILYPVVQQGEQSGEVLCASELSPKGFFNWIQLLYIKFYSVFLCHALQTQCWKTNHLPL